VTCPNLACRRTDPHDATGCVVAREDGACETCEAPATHVERDALMRDAAGTIVRADFRSCAEHADLDAVPLADSLLGQPRPGAAPWNPDSTTVQTPTPDRAYFMPPRFKL
jgi:hypothetical protein